ncbi:MAG TPA: hypothetical protein VKG26_01865, partial [Bacteroidia bacterium]|nr:hypothetical protein [Bacteroidia bacterium]
MKKALALLLLLIGTKGFTQTKTVYYDKNNNEVPSLELANTYKVIALSNGDTSIEVDKTYLKSGQIISQDFYTGSKKDKLTGTSYSWYNNGNIQREVDYSNGELNGTCKTYWPNGEVKRE